MQIHIYESSAGGIALIVEFCCFANNHTQHKIGFWKNGEYAPLRSFISADRADYKGTMEYFRRQLEDSGYSPRDVPIRF